MTPEQIERITTGFDALAPQGPAIVERFYDRLFEGRPTVRALFPHDMAGQEKHLLGAIVLVVKHLGRLAEIEPALEQLGERHVAYGAAPEHYAVVRDELVGALADVAGDAWSEADAEAWTGALDAVAQIMLRGAGRAGAEAA